MYFLLLSNVKKLLVMIFYSIFLRRKLVVMLVFQITPSRQRNLHAHLQITPSFSLFRLRKSHQKYEKQNKITVSTLGLHKDRKYYSLGMQSGSKPVQTVLDIGFYYYLDLHLQITQVITRHVIFCTCFSVSKQNSGLFWSFEYKMSKYACMQQ